MKTVSIDRVKNIIFDFGGVIINIDHQKLENAFKNLGINNFEQLFNKATQSDLFRKFEKGQITSQQFRNEIRKLIGYNASDEVLDNTWNQIIGDYPPQRIELLKQINQNYRLFLLSNTNKIHYRYYINKFRKEYGFDFLSLFEETYWSFRIGKRKPDTAPYLHVIARSKLKPEETLFIDDSVQNIIAARKTGLIAYHLKPGTEITDLFKNGYYC
ncbi:MAG: hypothetical protein B6D61_11815 [Bacteroidetes bacterium 4484_249]|nr:MAG: hypothetical protein B6D61_11815 [Bacteroidetes bacterium 4484_249]